MKQKLHKTGGTARGHLRACTDSAHQRLHELPLFDRLQKATISLEEYAMLMSALATFYIALDALVTRACNEYLDGTERYEYRPRAPLVEADAAEVCHKLRPVRSFKTTSLDTVLPVIRSRAAFAGVIYVVDGATMGGRVLNKAAAKVLDEEDVNGRSYWQWCEDHGALQWKSALALIEVCGQELSHRWVMGEAALATFEALESHLAVRTRDDLAGAA